MHRSMLAGVLAVAALAMAGCTGTGNFDVQQTEPFRVSLEGEPQTVVVSEDDSEGKEVVIDTCDDPCDDADAPEQVNVKVQVKAKVVDEACIVKIIIKDSATGEVLEEREVDTGSGDDGDDGSTSTVTQTETQTQTVTQTETETESSGIVIENIVVNVKGKDNIVVLTQAIQGSADVDISAASATGTADADASIDDGGDASASASETMSASASASASYSGSPP